MSWECLHIKVVERKEGEEWYIKPLNKPTNSAGARYVTSGFGEPFIGGIKSKTSITKTFGFCFWWRGSIPSIAARGFKSVAVGYDDW
jgi:hypothetical protein